MNLYELNSLIEQLENENKNGNNDYLLDFYYQKRIELKSRIIANILNKI